MIYPNDIKECVFCNIGEDRVVFSTPKCLAIRDGYPVVLGHCLVLPKKHKPDFFHLSELEILECFSLLEKTKNHLMCLDSTIKGFNIGVNNGSVAGQTINHCHIHLIPRRDGDVFNPVGGVRNIIPGQGDYTNGANKNTNLLSV